MFSLKDIIEIAIQIEQNGEGVYRKALKTVSDLSLVSLLQNLAEDEARHTQWFSQLENQEQTHVDDPHVEQTGRAILQEILGNQTFSLGDADFSKMEDIKALVATALEFEKDTVLFYEMIRAFVQDQDVLRQLEKVIDEEQKHARELKHFLEDTF